MALLKPMALRIVPYQAEHVAEVLSFNERAVAHEAPFTLSKTPLAGWLPKRDGLNVFREFFLALDGEQVRGGFTLRRQAFWVRGMEREVANYQGPLSEGLWDRRWMVAGTQMLRTALREQPLLYALGMGGTAQPLPKLLAAAGWSLAEVPFRFRVLRPAAFLRNIQALRRTASRARLLDFAAASSFGPLALHTLNWVRTKHGMGANSECEPVTQFGPWADEIWEQARTVCTLSAVRNRAAQNILFGDGNPKNIALRCTRAGRDIGWAVVRSTRMQADKYFGDMQVGSLVDALALPGEEATVVHHTVRHLHTLGSDLVVTNQSHARWLAALRTMGFFAGPSNFILACSPQLSEAIGPLDQTLGGIHINRADGDGPIHL